MKLGYIGLGKMGLGMVERLVERRHEVVVFDQNEAAMQQAAWKGAAKAQSVWNVIDSLERPRLIWLMVPHKAVDEVLKDLVPRLHEGDTIIDGGNSFYKNSCRRAQELQKRDISFLDAGVSGGPEGARQGACVMIGGNEEVYKKYESLFEDIAAQDAYAYVGESGAGHFVKMVHNGIEYGMMQSLAEGFDVIKHGPYQFDLAKIANLYNHRSVIESRLIEWLEKAYREHGDDLDAISGAVAQSGEGEWTVEAAREFSVSVPILEGSVAVRKQTETNPNYAGKILSALRGQFGGHDVSTKQ